jgi:hypothetical protein
MTSGRFAGRWLAIALVAALTMTLTVSVAGAGATQARNIAGAKTRDAVAAKKKCKKKKKGVTSAKKKKCKRKHVLSLPGPIVRATISWPAGEVDLHAFDAAGNRSGIAFPCSTLPCPMSEGIPNATHSPDANNGGSETFTDNIFVKGGSANREFAYAVCFYTSESTTVTFTIVNRLGQSQSLPITDSAGGGHAITVTGGPAVPSSFACPL